MISVMANEFYLQIFGSSRLLLASYISLVVFPFIFPSFLAELRTKRFSVVRAFFIEFLLLISLALFFNFISPLEGAENTTSFNTGIAGRSILGGIRIFSDFALMVFIIFMFKNKIIDILFFAKTIFIITLVHIPVTIFDFIFHYPIKSLFISDIYDSSRPHGFCHEPKGLGRLTFGAMLLFISYALSDQTFRKELKYAIWVLGLLVLVSFSASAFLAGIMTFLCILLLTTNIRNLSRTAIVMGVLAFVVFGLSKLGIFQEITLKKIDFALGFITRDKRPDEPAIFTFLEVFDRSAAYFFIKNPEYLFFGTGPNLVSIPATHYMSGYYSSFMDRADGLPQTVIYYISRSGLVGVAIFTNIFINLRKKILLIDNKAMYNLLIGIYVFTAMNNQIWFMVYLGLIYSHIYYNSEKSLV